MTQTFRSLALAVVAVFAVGACSEPKATENDGAASDRPTVEVTAQPQDPQLARVIVEQVFGNLTEGDWAGAWELWTNAAKSAVAREAYVELLSSCTAQVGGTYEVISVSPVDAATANVKWKHVKPNGTEESGTSVVRYQDGAWRFEPDPKALEAYKQNKCQ